MQELVACARVAADKAHAAAQAAAWGVQWAWDAVTAEGADGTAAAAAHARACASAALGHATTAQDAAAKAEGLVWAALEHAVRGLEPAAASDVQLAVLRRAMEPVEGSDEAVGADG